MDKKSSKENLLRKLPSIDALLTNKHIEAYTKIFNREVITSICRQIVGQLRHAILKGNLKNLDTDMVVNAVLDKLERERNYHFTQVVNATGVVLHTNLGRSPLSEKAKKAVIENAFAYCNLEYRLEEGIRGTRQEHTEELLCRLTGAEDAYVVNNNAGAVMLVLNSLAFGKEVIVSRGHLIEIGGSFRLPDVMGKSGAKMVEVGSTNKTHLRDYENAISSETEMLFFTHWSNFAMVGFVENPTRAQLVELANKHNLPVIEDLGSGSLVDLAKYGLLHEPTPQESLSAGVSVVTFSGDKLLGGPQSGIILGKKEYISKIRKNQMARALRIDKMTIAALEATLRHYLNENESAREIPIIRMLTLKKKIITKRAKKLYNKLKDLPNLQIELVDGFSEVGGGAMPLQKLPTKLISIKIEGESAEMTSLRMRKNTPPIVTRINKEKVLIDLRTVFPLEEKIIIKFLMTG